MTELIHALIAWVAAHPEAAGATIALAAFSESLAFIGLLVPGALIMFAAGALIAGGGLEFWSTVLWAASGAALGDGLSYWLGRRYRGRIRSLWPFRRHPALLERGEAFFHRHGGKGVFLGRFVGPVRPVIPIVAGMLGMRPWRFYVANILSAAGWAPAYLLPGMAFGASLALAGRVAGRLALLLSGLLASAWLVGWLARSLYRLLAPRARDWAQRLLSWGRRHRRVRWLVGDLIDPDAPASRALLLWIALLIAGAWLFFGVLEDVLTRDPLVRADQAIYRALQGLRTPLGDRIMIAFSQLGDWPVTGATTLAGLAWLVLRRAKRDAAYWLTAIAFGGLAVLVIKPALQVARPSPAIAAAGTYSFPSGHATMSLVIYGYLSVLAARDFSVRWRWIVYAIGSFLVVGIAFSRLYLGVHWLSDVAGGLGLGATGVALIAIARQRHARRDTATRVSWVAAATLIIAGTWHAERTLSSDLQRYAVHLSVRTLQMGSWWQSQWRALPAQRIDLRGSEEQPLNVQWAGELANVHRDLLAGGWRDPIPLGARTALRWLAPTPSIADLPLTPQLHDGLPDALAMIRGSTDTEGPLVLRLWPAPVRLEPGGAPLWIGTVTAATTRPLLFITLPTSADDYDRALIATRQSIRQNQTRIVRRPGRAGRGSTRVLLIRSPRGPAPAG
jgi:membrane protein DedA with SNARE-associated domain